MQFHRIVHLSPKGKGEGEGGEKKASEFLKRAAIIFLTVLVWLILGVTWVSPGIWRVNISGVSVKVAFE